jgi:hypothetical protein
MHQVLHILKKDIRCFAGEIALFLASCGIVIWNETRFMDLGLRSPQMYSMLLLAVGVYLVSKVIHAEAIPGDRWFWQTRPYHWKSLLAEKLLFIFLFVSLPVTITVLVILTMSGFSISTILPWLLLWQVFMFVAWVLPVATLASVTEGMTSFMGGAVLLIAAQIALMRLIEAPQPLAPSWVPGFVSGLVIVVGAAAILYWQYKVRRTTQGRAAVGVAVVLSLFLAALVPATSALDLKARFFPGRVAPSLMKVVLVPGSTRVLPGAVTMLLEVQGISAGMEPQAEWFAAQLIDSDGNTRAFPERGGWVPSSTPGGLQIETTVNIFTADELRGKPVTLRGKLYLTLFGDSRSWTTAPGQQFEIGRTTCRAGHAWPQLSCSTLFDRSPGILDATVPGHEKVRVFDPYRQSFSPLPRLTLDLMKREEVPLPGRTKPVEFSYLKPVAHFWLNFEIPVERFLE